MKKLLLTTALGLMTVGAINALPVNRALSFSSDGVVDCGAMPELDGKSSYSLQFWLSPDEWKDGAVVLKRANFEVKLGANNTVEFVNGSNKVSATGFTPGKWNQVTLIVNNGKASVLVNSADGGNGDLGSLESTKRAFFMGGGYSGLLDEVRVWDNTLDANSLMKTFDYFTNNTINRWNPMWDNLVAYYKMDQENCPQVVEYKNIILATRKESVKANDNHGKISGGVKKVAIENENMPYLVSAAYIENARFYDRLIPQDAYLLSNEIIILGADCVADDGSVSLKTPNNHATMRGNVSHVASQGNRNGVVYLDGQPTTYIEAPAQSIHKYKLTNLATSPYQNTDLSGFSFLTRIYLESWQPGAIIFSKENATKDKGICVYLGEKENTIVARINGKVNTSVPLENFKLNQWAHLAFVVDGTQKQAKNKVKFYGWAVESVGDDDSAIESTSLTEVADEPIKIGVGLKGWLDETYLSNKNANGDGTKFTKDKIANIINNGCVVPSPKQGRNVDEMNAAGFLYNYDNSSDLGYSDYSQDNILKQIRKQYEGYTQPRVILSVRGHSQQNYDDAFMKISWDTGKTEKFAKQLVDAAKDYDGVEFDFEWLENNLNAEQKTNFAKLPEAVKAVLPKGKIFRISIHNSYYVFAEPWKDDNQVTGFTIQQYGPNPGPYYYTSFTDALKTITGRGYAKNKLMTSFSTTMTEGGVRLGALKNWTFKDENYSTYEGATFMTPLQVFRRARDTRNGGYMGIFYWDMGNEYWLGSIDGQLNFKYEGMPEYNQTCWANYGLSANVDPVVSSVTVNHSPTDAEPAEDVTPDDPSTTDPGTEEPGTSDDPSTEDPGTSDDPSGEEPGTSDDPSGEEPGTSDDPSGEDPGTSDDPSGEEPGTSDDPSIDEPGNGETEDPGTDPSDPSEGEEPGNGETEDPGNNGGEENPDAGVDGILYDTEEFVNVYSITGALVKKNVSRDELNGRLEKGIYIINGKKVVIR